MVELLETKFRGMTGSRRFKQPVAVILTKSDAFDLEQKIDKDAALQYRQSHPELQWDADAINALVEQFLQDYGAGNFLRNLRGKFDNVKFFSCSTIGVGNNSETASAFEGERVLEPLLWLLKETKTLPRKVSKGIPV